MSDNGNQGTLHQPMIANDHTLGPGSARVQLVEYGDYQSSDCALAHRFVTKVMGRLDPCLRFAFRHFAVTEVHPHSQRAAEAAEAAGSQGKFWQMHEILFAHQGALSNGHLVEYADAIGLDTARFLREVAAHVHVERIRGQLKGGLESGVDRTPTFFANGRQVEHQWCEAGLLRAVEAALAGER